MSAPVLEIRDVVKSYGRDKALDGVSLMLRPGDHVGLLGPNGAGKSTLFQIVAGLFAPDSGEVRLFGQTHRDGGAAILRRLGVVFQARSIDMDMSVLANLRCHNHLRADARAAARCAGTGTAGTGWLPHRTARAAKVLAKQAFFGLKYLGVRGRAPVLSRRAQQTGPVLPVWRDGNRRCARCTALAGPSPQGSRSARGWRPGSKLAINRRS